MLRGLDSCDSDDQCDPVHGGVCMKALEAGRPNRCWYPTKNCYLVQKVNGKWLPGPYSSGSQEIEVSYGVTRSYEVTNTATWGANAGFQTKTGFDLKVVSGETTVSGAVSTTLAEQFAKPNSLESFAMSKTTTYKQEVPAGQIWQ